MHSVLLAELRTAFLLAVARGIELHNDADVNEYLRSVYASNQC